MSIKGNMITISDDFFCLIFSRMCLSKPHQDKTNKMTCAPSEDSDQPVPDQSLRYLHEEALGR